MRWIVLIVAAVVVVGTGAVALSALPWMAAGLALPVIGFFFARHPMPEDSERDPTTGLARPRLLDRRCREEVRRARKTGGAVSVLLVDVDSLSEINRLMGQPAGDSVLRLVALAMGLSCRKSDVAIRRDGDEFALLAPGTPAAAASLVAQRIQDTMTRLVEERPHLAERRVSVSIGIADLERADDPSADALMGAATAALKHAKLRRGGIALAPRRLHDDEAHEQDQRPLGGAPRLVAV